LTACEQCLGMVGVFKVAVPSVVAAVTCDLRTFVVNAQLLRVEVDVEVVTGVLSGDAVAVGLNTEAEGAGGTLAQDAGGLGWVEWQALQVGPFGFP